MKKPLLIFLVAVCLLSLTACVGGNNTVSVSTLPPASASANAVSSAAIGTESAAPDTSDDATADNTQQPQTSQSKAGESSSIIAESSNAVSDKEKEAILDNLSSQLDGMLNDSKSLDDIDNSDLDMNN